MSFVAPWSSGSCSNTGFDMMGAVTLAKWPQTSWLLPSLGFFAVGNSKTGQTHQSCKFVQGQDHVSLDPTTVLIKSGCTCCLSNYCPVLNPRWLRMGYRNTIAIHQRHEHLAFSFFLATLYVTVFYLSPSITKPTLFFCKQHLCAGYLCFQFLLWHIAFCAATAIVLTMD